MDPASPIDSLLDIFDSLGESLDTLARDAGIDRRYEYSGKIFFNFYLYSYLALCH
jgi:hypothetical protein